MPEQPDKPNTEPPPIPELYSQGITIDDIHIDFLKKRNPRNPNETPEKEDTNESKD